jgi:hypothetical protein
VPEKFLDKELIWSIQPTRGEVKYPIRYFPTKREAVNAMEADRQPKTPVVRDDRHYIFTMKT